MQEVGAGRDISEEALHSLGRGSVVAATRQPSMNAHLASLAIFAGIYSAFAGGVEDAALLCSIGRGGVSRCFEECEVNEQILMPDHRKLVCQAGWNGQECIGDMSQATPPMAVIVGALGCADHSETLRFLLLAPCLATRVQHD